MKEISQNIKLYLGVCRRLGNTLTIGMMKSDRRAKLLELYNVFSSSEEDEYTPIDHFIIPKTDIFEIFDQNQAVYEGVYECGFGHTTEFELKVISNLVKKYNPNRIFELGTFQGRTTLNMAINSHEKAEIITLDLPSSELQHTKMSVEKDEERYIKKEISGARFIDHPQAYKIKQVYGDSATYSFDSLKNSVDFAFIDGSHAFDYVMNDSNKIFPMMRKGGIILWHDYTNWEGVWTALNQLYKTDSRFKNIKHIGGTSIAMMEIH